MRLIYVLLMCVGVAGAQDSQPSLNLETAINVQGTDPVHAIELYNEVVEQSVVDNERNIAAFNRGVLLMDAEDLGAAEEAFRLAGRYATTAEQRRDAMFNLGHALNSGVDSSGQLMMDPEKIGEMIEALGGVERAFLDASRADRGHIESKRNVERIRRQIQELQNMKDQIEEQQESEEQQEGEDGEKSEGGEDGQGGEQGGMADELQDLADQQREQAQESESAAQNQPQSEQQERSDEQKELSDETEDAKEQMEESGADQETMDDLKKAMDAQQEAKEALDKGDNETAAQKQQEAADALERAAERVREAQQEQESEQEGQQGQPQDQPGEGEEPEIDEVAQQLLDKERRERERRQAYRATGRPVKVEEDW